MSKSYNLLKWHSLPLSILVLSSRFQTSHSWILVVWKVLLLWKTFSYSRLRTRPCIMWFRVGALTPLFFWLHNPIRYEHLQSFTRIFNPNHCTPPSFTTHRRQNCNDSGLSPSLLILLHFSLSLSLTKKVTKISFSTSFSVGIHDVNWNESNYFSLKQSLQILW